MSDLLWIDGHLTPASQARISPLDRGWLTGDGIFETLAARGGRIEFIQRHHQRLQQGSSVLDLPCPSLSEFSKALQTLLQAYGQSDARLRFTISRGESTPVMVATLAPLPQRGPVESVVIVPWTRNEHGALAGIKATSYAENLRALAFAKERHAGEAIFANTRGELCEGATSNVFVVRDGRLLTPPLSSGCLPGVTRAAVIESATQAGLIVQEAAMTMEQFQLAEEAFLTSATRHVHPIARINGRALHHAPGDLTRKTMVAYQALLAKEA